MKKLKRTYTRCAGLTALVLLALGIAVIRLATPTTTNLQDSR